MVRTWCRAVLLGLAASTMASVWHYLGKEGNPVLDAPGVTACDIKGGPVRKERAGQKTAIPVGSRRILLHFPGRPAEAVRRLLAEATLELRKPVVLCGGPFDRSGKGSQP